MAYLPLHREGYMPLMRAAIEGSAYEVALLIEQRADLDAQTTDG